MIEIKDVSKNFTHGYALKNINLTINEKELVILKGVSGSGKSTLLSIMAALQKPTSGEIRVDNKLIAKLPDFHASSFRAKTIGFVFQSFNLFDTLSVKENVSLTLIPLGFSPKEIDKKTKTVLKLANISHKETQKVEDLSGGEKQRCVIARALVNDPKIILCDEPTANLDLKNSSVFIDVLRELKQMGKTIVVATHDPLFEDLDFVDRVIDIQDGMI